MNIDDFCKGLLFKISNDKILKEQTGLYFDFADKKVSSVEYFDRQEKIDESLLQESEEISWENLNEKDYVHEKAHFDVWNKYGVESILCWWGKKNVPLVMDRNFKDVATKNNFSSKKIIKILKEMLVAPYSKGDLLIRCSDDLLFFEILDKNINSFNIVTLRKAFLKYFT